MTNFACQSATVPVIPSIPKRAMVSLLQQWRMTRPSFILTTVTGNSFPEKTHWLIEASRCVTCILTFSIRFAAINVLIWFLGCFRCIVPTTLSCTMFIILLQLLYLNWQKTRRRQQSYSGDINTKKVRVCLFIYSQSVMSLSNTLFFAAKSTGHLHHFYEVNEATMLHTKSKVAHNTLNWKSSCKIPHQGEHGCSLGIPYPIGADPKKEKFDKDGWAYNCFINEKIETYWWPRLVEAIKARG